MRRVWNITEYPSVKDGQDNQDTLAGAKIAADITIAYVRAMTGVCPSGRLRGENARRFYATPDRLQTVSKPSFGQNRGKPTSHLAAAAIQS